MSRRWRLWLGDIRNRIDDWRMPTERHALRRILRARERLRRLGWSDATYCPKDGTKFAAIEFGSTGIHRCSYSGHWPKGTFWVEGGGDLWPSRPVLYHRDVAKVTPESPASVEAWQKTLASLAEDGTPE